MGLIRFLLALWVGKWLMVACRLVRMGGSSLPGRVALRIYPLALRRLSQQARWGSIVISGTNGKTTTALLLANMLQASGWAVVHNRTGANLIYGITSTFIAHSSWAGRIQADVNILECDEAALAAIAREVTPRGAIITNFFRDQLDRFGELEHTVNMVTRGLDWMRADGWVALNADDPAVAALAQRTAVPAVFYGVEDAIQGTAQTSDAAELRWCSGCGSPYSYEFYYLAHLGLYACHQCGQARPHPQVCLMRRLPAGIQGAELVVGYGEEVEFTAHLSIPGLYNAYNALAAAAAALALGLAAPTVAASFEESSASFGRMERLEVAGRQVIIALIKNPAGGNEVLRTVLEDDQELYLLMAINDRLADGTDVSWLWDTDFELLCAARHRLRYCATSGVRALDMAVRLKYAGLQDQLTGAQADLAQALEQALQGVPPGKTLHILPTYTAMLALRRVLNRQGYGRHFWEV